MKLCSRVSLWFLFAVFLVLTPAFAGQAPYYQGKNIIFLINFAAGGPTDIEGRIVARHLAKHIPGNPTVIVQNMAGAGGVTGQARSLRDPSGEVLAMAACARAEVVGHAAQEPAVERLAPWIEDARLVQRRGARIGRPLALDRAGGQEDEGQAKTRTARAHESAWHRTKEESSFANSARQAARYLRPSRSSVLGFRP